MACKYCKEGKPVLLGHYVEMYITSDNYLEVNQYSSSDGHFLIRDAIDINFCPMCGEKLGDAL